MADKTNTIVIGQAGDSGNEEILEKWIDQGDGTYARKVAAELVVGDVVIGEVDQGAAGTEAWKVEGIAAGVALPASDKGPAWTPAHGIASVPFTSADAQTAAPVTSVPTAGQKLVITDLFVSNNSTVDLQFTFVEETSSTVIFGPVAIPAGMSAQFTPRGRWKLPVADKRLLVDVSAAGNVMVDAHYFSEA